MNDILEEHCWINVDKLRLNQILINLIDNAIKFSKRDDAIKIMTRHSNDFDLNLNQTQTVRKKGNSYSNRAEEEDLIGKKENQVYIKIRYW